MKVFDVWADWCAPCKRFAPIFAKVASEFPEVEFAQINADANIQFLNDYNIQSIPTILITDDNGDILFAHSGILVEQVFRNLVSTYLLQSNK
jgi:thioredoxin 1